ncbi:MAG: translation initiation factor IF-2 [Chloroflexi bacterium]|nr:MAG: translation initiation factor IF-2 [Chloroflexota bacterium]MBL1196634.1 translation initiation factor IF-2 [Chloroflexota bacterium]NOH13927.1 translation initiation factor IF-2 [Chloroflexota bacterium]
MSENVSETKTIELPSTMTVRDLAESIEASPIDVIKVLMTNGVMANINQLIDFDTAAIVAAEMGFEASLQMVEQLEASDAGEVPLWRRLIASEDEKDLQPRPPVVTILGHVDHGKTTLLDAIRESNVQAGEVGGITQHISAYQVKHNDRLITFLDTPGHAAFTAMRSRGAQGADVVILVVAADDGVMPQTKEALAHAKAAKVPMIVAMTKIDKSNANADHVKQQLADEGLIPDEWDGDTIVVPVSGTEKIGIEDLLEAILLVADNTEILANDDGTIIGTVIEAERDKSRGTVASLLVQNGTLNVGDVVLAGTSHGKLRAMFDFYGEKIESAGPSTPVQVMGLNSVPDAGELFRTVDSEKDARAIVAEREDDMKEAQKKQSSVMTLESMFDRYQAGEVRELRLIVKADVQGSLEPIVSSLQEISASDVEGQINVNVLHAGTGNIVESDMLLAASSQAIVMGFNVTADSAAHKLAEKEHISIRHYDIIYRLIEDVEKALKGMLEPEERETVIGHAQVRAIFKISRYGKIAGCRVTDGEIRRNARMRVIRNKEVIHDGEISSLKHEKDDVRDVREGFECGINLKEFDDIQEGDVLEAYVKELVAVA